jgi:hypothetical protein
MSESATSPYTDDALQKEALNYKTRGEFYKKSRKFYDAAHYRGKDFLDKICSHMKESITNPYSFEELLKISQKYSLRKDLKKNDGSAYVTILKLPKDKKEQCFSHMGIPLWEIYSKEEVLNISLNFKTRSEFKLAKPGAYSAAKRLGIFDKATVHMKRSAGSSYPEEEILKIVKKLYPSAFKLKSIGHRFLDKPFIHGFEIDIYVPELKLGIEFDGTTFHSYKYLRGTKKKSKWSDDDIRNYHKLKDDWFALDGIKILHIPGVDWKESPEACIQRCLDFLASK